MVSVGGPPWEVALFSSASSFIALSSALLKPGTHQISRGLRGDDPTRWRPLAPGESVDGWCYARVGIDAPVYVHGFSNTGQILHNKQWTRWEDCPPALREAYGRVVRWPLLRPDTPTVDAGQLWPDGQAPAEAKQLIASMLPLVELLLNLRAFDKNPNTPDALARIRATLEHSVPEPMPFGELQHGRQMEYIFHSEQLLNHSRLLEMALTRVFRYGMEQGRRLALRALDGDGQRGF